MSRSTGYTISVTSLRAIHTALTTDITSPSIRSIIMRKTSTHTYSTYQHSSISTTNTKTRINWCTFQTCWRIKT